eukprot:scaffold350_cov133-Cylindrotheca_fusiformis.AAC.13
MIAQNSLPRPKRCFSSFFKTSLPTGSRYFGGQYSTSSEHHSKASASVAGLHHLEEKIRVKQNQPGGRPAWRPRKCAAWVRRGLIAVAIPSRRLIYLASWCSHAGPDGTNNPFSLFLQWCKQIHMLFPGRQKKIVDRQIERECNACSIY